MRGKLGKKVACEAKFSKDSCRVDLPKKSFYCRSVMGSEDHHECYELGRSVALCSMNRQAVYVCVEVFDKQGCKAICFANPEDCAEMFKTRKLENKKLKSYCQKLLKEI